MNISIKKAVAFAILAGTAVTALPAIADTVTPDTGNGELVLYVYDSHTDQTYVRGLGVTEDSLLTIAQAQSSGYAGSTMTENKGIAGLPHDSGLTAFLATDPAADYTYAIMAGGVQNGGNVKNTGADRYVTTALANFTGGAGSKTNSQLNGAFGNLLFTQTAANGAINSGATLDKASGVSDVGGVLSPNLSPNPQGWYGSSLNQMAALGQQTNLYMLVTNGTATGVNGGNTTLAQYYKFLQVTLDANGDLTSAAGGTAPVPVPAALWLLGSGLVGLAGVGRRRRLQTA